MPFLAERPQGGEGMAVSWTFFLFTSLLQKLLQAVAKYGAQDWFKIREEVPGRSDAQCRDR